MHGWTDSFSAFKISSKQSQKKHSILNWKYQVQNQLDINKSINIEIHPEEMMVANFDASQEIYLHLPIAKNVTHSQSKADQFLYQFAMQILTV